MQAERPAPPTPKGLILNLLLAANGRALSAADAIASARLFGLRDNSVRVALVRLNAAGLIASAGRGAYVLGPQAVGLASDIAGWRNAETSTCDWDGSWLTVCTAALPRSDRSALSLRERALALLGFKPLSEGLSVRPANLVGHAQAVRARLHALGLSPAAPVFVAHSFDAALNRRARGLWDELALDATYARTRQRLERWLADSKGLDTEAAARESYLLGNAAIRQLVFDPLLPEPLVDTRARRDFRDAVRHFDAEGHRIWQRLLPSLRPPLQEAANDA